MTQETSSSEGGPRSGPPRGAPRRDGPPGGGGGAGGRYGGPPGLRRPRRKVCTFCVDKVQRIDYKDVGRIRRYVSDRGKIDPRRKSGTCAKHQRMLTTALKRARPPKPERPPFRPAGEFRPAGAPMRPAPAPQPAAPAPQPAAAAPQPAAPVPAGPQSPTSEG